MTVESRTLAAPERSKPLPFTPRNPGVPLALDLVREVRVNTSAVERRTATFGKRRTVKKEWQVAWLLRAVTLM
ncbi:MAG: deoxyribose-phosphate aldolase, partial [Gemmatimonadetes bacterium]|nr:deoxyribose-phosphate aldolase [Gemmatimonadota bacterium]